MMTMHVQTHIARYFFYISHRPMSYICTLLIQSSGEEKKLYEYEPDKSNYFQVASNLLRKLFSDQKNVNA